MQAHQVVDVLRPHRRKKSRHPFAHAARWVTGWCLMALGVIGLFVPILQGILFLLIGMLLLAPYVPLFRALRRKILHRFPGFRSRLRELKRRWVKKKKA